MLCSPAPELHSVHVAGCIASAAAAAAGVADKAADVARMRLTQHMTHTVLTVLLLSPCSGKTGLRWWLFTLTRGCWHWLSTKGRG